MLCYEVYVAFVLDSSTHSTEHTNSVFTNSVFTEHTNSVVNNVLCYEVYVAFVLHSSTHSTLATPATCAGYLYIYIHTYIEIYRYIQCIYM